MIIVRLQGGLGNQMFQYATGLALAMRRDVPLKIDLSLMAVDPKRSYELHRFQIDTPLTSTWDRWRIGQSIRPERRWLAAMMGFRYVRDREQGYDESIRHAGRQVLLDGYWQSGKYFAGLEPVLRRRFTFRDAPDADNAAMLRTIAAGPSVAVHVRRGDYVSDPQTAATLRPCGVEYYRWAFENMAAAAAGTRYFVFSDDPDWARQNVHPPGETTYVSHNTGRQDHEDFRLMKHCRHFIIANSSFSWWAAWLGEALDKHVIAPRPWFATPHGSEADLVPLSWIRPD